MNYRQAKKFYKKRKHRRYDKYREQVVIDVCSKYANEHDMIYILQSRSGKRIENVSILKDVKPVGTSSPNDCVVKFSTKPEYSCVQEFYDKWNNYVKGE